MQTRIEAGTLWKHNQIEWYLYILDPTYIVDKFTTMIQVIRIDGFGIKDNFVDYYNRNNILHDYKQVSDG